MQNNRLSPVRSMAHPATEDSTLNHLLKTKNDIDHARCLVVDDDPVILNLVAEMLTAIGYHVQTAQKLTELNGALETGRYELAVLDLIMPDMNGYDLAGRIKNKALAGRVVIMTGHPEKNCKAMMTTGLVDGWLFKPFGLNELRFMLQSLQQLACPL